MHIDKLVRPDVRSHLDPAQPPTVPAAVAAVLPTAGSVAATTFSVMHESTTCGAQDVVAGTAGSPGLALAGCDGTVGSPDFVKVVSAAVDQPVYIQLSGQGPITFTVSPAANVRVEGLKVVPLRSGTTTVTVTHGLYCAYLPALNRQPTSCTLMLIQVER